MDSFKTDSSVRGIKRRKSTEGKKEEVGKEEGISRAYHDSRIMDAGNPIRPDYPLESARQVRGRTYGNVVYACDEGKVYRGPPPQLPPPVSNAPETPYASRITATLGLSPPLSPSPFAIYPRIVAAECVNKRRAQARDAARNFRSGGGIVIQSSRVHSLLWFHSARWINLLRVDYAEYDGMEEEIVCVCRRARFHFRKLSEGSRDRNPLITRNRFYRLPRRKERKTGGGRGRERERGRREAVVGARWRALKERSLIIRWEWRERSSSWASLFPSVNS